MKFLEIIIGVIIKHYLLVKDFIVEVLRLTFFIFYYYYILFIIIF